MAYRIVRLDAAEARDNDEISINAKVVTFIQIPVNDLEIRIDSIDNPLWPVPNPIVFDHCSDDGFGFFRKLYLTHGAGAGEIIFAISDGGVRVSYPLA